MNDSERTKSELIEGLQVLRERVAELENAGAAEVHSQTGSVSPEGPGEPQSLEALQESEEKYHTLFRDSVLAKSLTIEGRIIDVNPAWLNLHGYDSRNEVIGMSVLDVVHPEDRDILIRRRKASAPERAPVCEYRDLKKDGSTVNVEVHSSQITLHGAQAIHATIQDITVRKQTEKEKEELQGQLLQSQKMEALGVLAGGVAHDFNNQLTTIRGFTEMLMMETDKESPVYADLERIFNACNRSASLVHQLLLFSHKHQVEFRSIDLNEALGELVKMMQRLVGENIKLSTELDENVPLIWADPTRLEQVVLNLVVNARDAMPQGGKITIKTGSVLVDDAHSVRIVRAHPGQYVCLSVADTGEGMDTDTLQHIFEPFFSTKSLEKGTGLGLSVVYGIVEQHGGWIEIDTELGKGTEFAVYLPISSAPLEERDERPEVAEPVRGNGERIMVVEDDPEILYFVGKVLRENGFCSVEVSSAEEGLRLYEEDDLALVFSDCVLPDESGLWLVERLLARKPDLGIVMTTGYTDDRRHWEVIHEKGFEFVPKPYGIQDVLQAVSRALSKRKEGGAAARGKTAR